MNHIMVDLETLGTNSDAVITSIGAVCFSKDGIQDSFYTDIAIESSLDKGLSITADTIRWWMRQEDAARINISDPAIKTALPFALKDFAIFLEGLGDISGMWGNGATFDNVILSNAYKACNIKQPWPWWADKCFRTMKSQFGVVNVAFEGVQHNALADAKHQAKQLIQMYKDNNWEL